MQGRAMDEAGIPAGGSLLRRTPTKTRCTVALPLRGLALAFVVGFLAACGGQRGGKVVAESGPRKPPKGFVALFNGKDLSGWFSPRGELLGAWSVVNGEIRARGKGPGRDALYTQEVFENFILELDYKISRRGNSGVFLHAPWEGRQSRVGIELQILDDAGKAPTKWCTGAIYDVRAPRVNAALPAGRWNHYRVEMNWPKLRVWLNGRKIHDLDVRTDPVLCFRFRDGHIALQRHGSDVAFRNIWIKRLPARLKWDTLDVSLTDGLRRTLGSAKWAVHADTLSARGGEGLLAVPIRWRNYELQGYIRRTDQRVGELRYCWSEGRDSGFGAEFVGIDELRAFAKQFEDNLPHWVVPVFSQPWLPFQLVRYGPFAEFRLNGVVVKRVLNHRPCDSDSVAFRYYGGSESLEIVGLRVRQLSQSEMPI